MKTIFTVLIVPIGSEAQLGELSACAVGFCVHQVDYQSPEVENPQNVDIVEQNDCLTLVQMCHNFFISTSEE